MPDVLGGMLARSAPPRSGPSTLGALDTALNYLSPSNLIYGAARGLGQGLLGGARLTQKALQGDPIDPGELLSAASLGVSGGLLAPPGGMSLGAGPLRRGMVQGGKSLVDDLKSGVLGAFKSTKARTIVAKTKERGGYSVNLQTGEEPAEGIMAGKYANTDPRTTVLEPGLLTPKQVEAHATKNAKVLSSPDHYFGTWTDPVTGKTYLDVSKRFAASDIRPATKFAEKTGQISMYNAGTGESPPVGSFPGFVTGAATPEGVVPYAQRLQEMGGVGREYMAQHPGADWWRTPNIERVYGKQNMPQASGLLASTSTNTKPQPNVQLMTEYMRRHLAGEPMIQPGWRAPENVLGGAVGPGSKMGLETGRGGRKANLLSAARGDLGAMRGEVVKEKVQALSGDPAAIVLDRIQVRLAEQPSAGIFAEAKEGVSPTGKNRQLVKDTITEQARIAGENPDTFSANVWAGVREHVKKTGELYGTPLPGSQRMTRGTESKSYDDLFVDLVARKAKKLGISVKALESKLRKGDAELLSHILVPTTALGGGLLYSRGSTE
jgi:hypothetical protein